MSDVRTDDVIDKKKKIKKRVAKSRAKMISNKLGVLYMIVLLAFVGLGIRLYAIVNDNNNDYQRRILSQQAYDSKTLNAKRGEIIDCNGTVLAASKEMYNVILNVKQVLDYDSKGGFGGKCQIETVRKLSDTFNVDEKIINDYIRDVPESQYFVVKRNATFEEMNRFLKYITKPKENSDDVSLGEESLYNENVKGVTFEKYYVRDYPQGKLACDVLGFARNESSAVYGLEEYYDVELTGTNGRQYGYLNDDTTHEYTTIPAVDGATLITTIDSNVQEIVEKHLKNYCEEYKDNYREGLGADNIGCIVMRANSGEVIAMGSYPNFDPNDPTNLSEIYSEEEIKKITEEGKLQETCDKLWRNYCITDTYEPGSVMKPFTVAMGLETGKITGNETYNCTGFLQVADHKIYCHNRYGDGVLDVKNAVAKSCNVALMTMVDTIGKKTFLEYQSIFNIGLRTNIDLAGESRTEGLVFNEKNLGDSELATASFGQGFNVTMIQMCAGYAALVNGGYYYEPHMVKRMLSSSGAVIKNIEPRLIKQVVSQSTSDKIKDYCNEVVLNKNTGWRAKPAGYSIGGKTGTAETLPRGNGEYVVSFICHAPADNPEIIVYVVIDRPNVEKQEDAKYATMLTREILTDILPYLEIKMTEELTDEDMEELKQRELSIYTNRIKEEDAELEASEEEQEQGAGIEGIKTAIEGNSENTDDFGDNQGE